MNVLERFRPLGLLNNLCGHSWLQASELPNVRHGESERSNVLYIEPNGRRVQFPQKIFSIDLVPSLSSAEILYSSIRAANAAVVVPPRGTCSLQSAPSASPSAAQLRARHHWQGHPESRACLCHGISLCSAIIRSRCTLRS